MKNVKVTAIIPCAGKGERSKQKENKLFSIIDGEPVILKTVKIFAQTSRIDEIVIIYRNGELEKIKGILSCLNDKPIRYVLGGNTRFESVKNALSYIEEGALIIHDGARPYLTKETLGKVIKSVLVDGSAVVGSTPTDTILEIDKNGNVIASSRNDKMLAKTPQAFMADKLKKAYELAGNGEGFTDDAGVYCSFIGKCKLIKDDSKNLKLTYKEDFENTENATRTGIGYDMHKLVDGRKLILGGVEIPNNKGLLGHSDADVLTHAIMDALLSSAHLRDIGYHFSDKDEKYKDISSMLLLEKVVEMLKENKIKPLYVSAVIMAEKPKLSKYIPIICESLANKIGIPCQKVSITATTLEGIGIIGREEGIGAKAYVLCNSTKD